jgi:hypothetical protein
MCTVNSVNTEITVFVCVMFGLALLGIAGRGCQIGDQAVEEMRPPANLAGFDHCLRAC